MWQAGSSCICSCSGKWIWEDASQNSLFLSLSTKMLRFDMGEQEYFRGLGLSQLPWLSLGEPCILGYLPIWQFVPYLAADSHIYISLVRKLQREAWWMGRKNPTTSQTSNTPIFAFPTMHCNYLSLSLNGTLLEKLLLIFLSPVLSTMSNTYLVVKKC